MTEATSESNSVVISAPSELRVSRAFAKFYTQPSSLRSLLQLK